jgi:hypothetical protein
LTSRVRRDTATEDTAEREDTVDADTPDLDDGQDASDSDTNSEADVPVVTCDSDERCREVLTGLDLCEKARCNPVTSRCEVERQTDCCASDLDCPAATDACVENTCLFPGLACVPIDRCAACQLDRDCADIAPTCTAGRCSEGTCSFERLETCCVDASDCDDADICTDAVCDGGLCLHFDNLAPGCCLRESVLDTSFSPAPEFVNISNVPDVGWTARETRFTPSPPAALYLGNPDTYSNASALGPHRSEARFALGAVRAGTIEVKFQIYIDLRPTPDVDRLRIFLKSATGEERNVYSKTVATLEAWHPVKRSVLVDAAGPWELIFAFDAVTVDTTRRFGVLVDDLDIKTGCGSEGCEFDIECADASPCTRDQCVDGACIQTPDPSVPGCSGCTSDLACDDGRRCTDDRCTPGGVCQNTARPGCCEADAQCDDGNPCTADVCGATGVCIATPIAGCGTCGGACDDGDICTIDRCVAATGECVREPIPGCCRGASECDDGDLCTAEICVDNRCSSSVIRGCCTSDAACSDGDSCTRDACIGNRCAFAPIADCCSSSAQCDDGDACTTEACVGNRCQTSAVAGCCQSNSQCDDGNSCTADTCTSNRCTSSVIPNCCATDSQCIDGNSCTFDTCASGRCNFAPIPNCCVFDSQCSDGNACTRDTCVGNRCSAAPIANCCTSDGQCNDNQVCTTDACVGNVCTSAPTPGCCTAASACDDGNPCTTDACVGNRCVSTPIPGCCLSASDCNDGNACTTNACTSNRCAYNPILGCTARECVTSAECEDGNACTTNTCSEGVCQTSPSSSLGCCRTANDCNDGSRCTSDFCLAVTGVCINPNVSCDDGNACTRDRCDANAGCVHERDPACACEEVVLWQRSFLPTESPDIDTDGSGFGLRWRVDGLNAFSPNQSLRYGDDAGTDYANGFRTFGRATGPTVTVPTATVQARLDFILNLDIDVEPDSFRVRALFDDQNIILWDHLELPSSLYGEWVPVSVELPATTIGKDIQVRFVFDSLDGGGNLGRGVAIDDIQLYTTCQ